MWEKTQNQIKSRKLLSRDGFKRWLLVHGFCVKRKWSLANRRNSKKPLDKSFPLGTAFLEQTLLCLYYTCQFLKTSVYMRIFDLHEHQFLSESTYCIYTKALHTLPIGHTLAESRLQQEHLCIQGYKHDPYSKRSTLPWVWGSWWAF